MKSKNCLVIFNNSWGEVDFILPILKFLYEQKFNVYTSFRSIQMLNKKKNYQDLYYILNQISKVIKPKRDKQKINFFKILLSYITRPKFIFIKLKSFRFSKIKSHIKNIKNNNTNENINFLKKKKIKIDTILCADFDSDYYDWITEYPDAKFILFPHAITLRGSYLNKFRNVTKKVYEESFYNRKYQLSKFPENTILFSGDKDELNYFKEFTPQNIVLKILGFPRLTNNWIKYLHFKIGSKFNKKISKKNLLLIIGKIDYLGINEIENKIKSTIKIAEDFGYNLIIKNHPRNQFNLKKYLNFSKKIKITESNLSISGTLKFCEIVILTSKSGVSLECAFQKKIVVEYYKYGGEIKKNKVYEYKINNQLQSIYKHLDLIYSCNSHSDLSNFFYKITTNKKFNIKILKKQNKTIMSKIYKSNDIKSILNYV